MNEAVRLKVRNRMADDLRENVRSLTDEIDNYGECFSTIEKTKIKRMIAARKDLAGRLDPPR